jgi:hypothetical protein
MSEQSGANSRPVVLPDLQGKGLVRQRNLSADLNFGYFVSRQSNSPPAATERANVVYYAKNKVRT